MLDEMAVGLLDRTIERVTRWWAPWKIRLKRCFPGYRPALMYRSMKRTALLLLDKISVAAGEGGILQRLISEPVEPVGEATLREKTDAALSFADRHTQKAPFLFLLTGMMLSVVLLCARGGSELAALSAFFCLMWLAQAMDDDYEPVAGGVRQRYLAAQLMRAGAYLLLVPVYFFAYARNGLRINVLLQGAMGLTLIVHAIVFVSFAAFNKRQQAFTRALSGVLGLAPALCCAAAAALGATTAAQETLIAAGGMVRLAGASAAFIAYEVEMIATLGGNRLRYGRLWSRLLTLTGFFMMILGAWLCALEGSF